MKKLVILLSMILMSCTYIPIHMSTDVSQIEKGDKVTLKTTTGDSYSIKVTKITNEDIMGSSKQVSSQISFSKSLISEMYPVQLADDVKIYTKAEEIIEIKVIELVNNHISGQNPEGLDYKIPLSDIEKIEKKGLSKGAKVVIIVGGTVTIVIIVAGILTDPGPGTLTII